MSKKLHLEQILKSNKINPNDSDINYHWLRANGFVLAEPEPGWVFSADHRDNERLLVRALNKHNPECVDFKNYNWNHLTDNKAWWLKKPDREFRIILQEIRR